MKRMTYIKRLALALMVSSLWSAPAFAVPGTIKLPNFSAPVLDGATQPSYTTFDNIIPNALADYYTFVPYTTADAVALGFPATCGNLAKGDAASTEDCYTISAKGFPQALSLQGIFGGGPGLVGLDGVTPLSTMAYGYGSGGPGWVLPYYDTTKPGVVAGTPVTGNAPAGPFAGGVWHFPAPTIKGAFGRPIRVQWLNDLPNLPPTGYDPTVGCGPKAPNCFPYNRITTHVHGAHVGPESDGLASAWFTPNFAVVGEDFVSTRQHGPEGTYFYPMDQESATIWYHDHAMGVTHDNTNMGMAGFFPITDANEQSLIAANILPTGAYELGFALQDRHFDAATGNMVMPDYPIYDLNSPGCTLDVNGLADPLTCALVPFMKDPADGHLVPYVAGHAWLLDPINVGAPFGAPSSTLEYFGNIPVVNGVAYGNYSVEPRVYRMRFIGGTDSRTWVMKLTYTTTDPVTGLPVQKVVPFWQIGTEQGLLNNPLPRNEMDLMPGERLDVLVDFTGIPAGTRIMMQNLGPDTPWPGYFDYLAGAVVPSVDIPNIMAFNVGPLTAPDNVIAPSAATNLRPLSPPVPAKGFVPALNNTRVVSLMEITDGFGRTMPTIDARGFKPVGIPVTEIVKLNDIEQWDIVNTTVDAHPMHLHQVAFKVIDRQLIDPLTFVPPTDDVVNQVFTPATYTVAPGSVPIPADDWDNGWKDTIASPPGYVTRVWAKFDVPGEYVWHCHILSHEEHDMMRNFIVTDAALAAPAPQSITVPATNTTGSYTIKWVGTAIPGVTYELQEATDSAFTTAVTVQNTTAPNFTATKTLNNTFYYRVRALPPAASGFTAGLWRVATNPVNVQYIAAPTNLTVSIASATQIKLSWTDASNNETSFAIWRSDNGGPFTQVGTVNRWAAGSVATGGTVYFNNDGTAASPLVAGTAYSYSVTAVNAAGASAPTNTAVVAFSAPATPTGLTALVTSAGQIRLSWTDASTNETSFAIWRSANGGPFTQIGTITRLAADRVATGGTVTFNNASTAASPLVAGTAYSYYVTAVNGTGASAPSNSVVVDFPAAPPTGLTALVTSASQISLSWTDASNNEASFAIWRSDNGGPFTQIGTLTRSAANKIATGGTVSFNNTSTAASPLVAGTAYSYYVTAVNAYGASAPSNTAVADFSAPAAPSNVAVSCVRVGTGGIAQCTLTWADNSTNETGFRIQRALNAGCAPVAQTVTQKANTVTWTTGNISRTATHYFRIQSYNQIGASAYVNAVPFPVPAPIN